jgi:hypothetical protein
MRGWEEIFVLSFFLFLSSVYTTSIFPMDRYKTIRVKLGWIGLFQTSLSLSNLFSVRWTFLMTPMHPQVEFSLSILHFTLPIIDRSRSIFSLRYYTWKGDKKGFLSFSFLYLPDIEFRIGNGKTWLWILSENYYVWKIQRLNRINSRSLFI